MNNNFENDLNRVSNNPGHDSIEERNQRDDNIVDDSIRRDTNLAGDSRTRDNDNDMVDDSRTRDNDNDMDKVLVGIFKSENEVINVIKGLKEIGYQEDEITLVAKDKEQMEHIDEITDAHIKTQNGNQKVGADAAIGAVIGGVAAAVPALGLLVIPGIGPLLAAGPIAVILGGIIAGGVAGSLVGVLSQMGVEEEAAKEYENYIQQGYILVLVEHRENLREGVYNTFKQYNSILADRSR